jgi:protein phosphatase-4 regulatory subunit 3
MFLYELAVLAKTIQMSHKSEFFRSLAQHGLFAIFEYTLNDSDLEIRTAVIAILSSILEGEAGLMRSFCLAQSKQNQKPLSELLVERFIVETDSGLRSQLREIIRMMVDTFRLDATEGLVNSQTESEEFLTMFYECSLSKLVEPITSIKSSDLIEANGSPQLVLSTEQADTCHHICELLCFMVKNHQYKSKFFFMGGILQNLALLLRCKDTYIRLCILLTFNI